jgi:AraC-like DNA-binding protein
VEQIKSADEIFLERTALIIEKKLGDSEFNLNALCLELGMKHPQLYRKVKALTGMSIKDFILSIRMKNATQLLLTGNFNIAEVGYMVGFSSPAYFTETFKKHFGQTPSDYLKTGDPDCS